MSRKKQTSSKVTDSEMEQKEKAVEETRGESELTTHVQDDKHQGEDVVEAKEPLDKVSEETKATDVSRAEAEVEPQEEPCEEERLKQKIEELEDKHLRLAAEFDNYKKRMARQYEEMMRFANDRILLELLEVVDNFERALHHENDNTDLKTFRKGAELIFSQMTTLLEKCEITAIEALGKPFDPNLHEAVMPIESEDYPEGVVAVEMSKGYMQGDRVLRHSKVGVSKGKVKEEENGEKS